MASIVQNACFMTHRLAREPAINKPAVMVTLIHINRPTISWIPFYGRALASSWRDDRKPEFPALDAKDPDKAGDLDQADSVRQRRPLPTQWGQILQQVRRGKGARADGSASRPRRT